MGNYQEKKNIFSTLKGAQTHWFLTPRQSDALSGFAETPKRLNVLDTKMLEDSEPEKGISSPLKMEFRIEDKEKQIKNTNEKIKIADTVGNLQESFTLKAKKQRLESELQDLYNENSASVMTAKVTSGINGSITEIKTRKMPVINAIKRFIKRYILAKVSRKFKSLVALGDSLDTLNAINRNVDELLQMKTPYGETAQNYQKLTEYLYKAHKIRSDISKSVKK